MIRENKKLDITEETKKSIEKLTEEFDIMVSNNNFSIDSLENLLLDNLDKYKNNLNVYTEEILFSRINEKELVSKKNANGKKKDIK